MLFVTMTSSPYFYTETSRTWNKECHGVTGIEPPSESMTCWKKFSPNWIPMKRRNWMERIQPRTFIILYFSDLLTQTIIVRFIYHSLLLFTIQFNFWYIISVDLISLTRQFSSAFSGAPDTKAKVEIQIARICLKKRKEVRTPIMKAFEGICEVKVQSLKNCTNSTSNTSSPTNSGSTGPTPTHTPNNNNNYHHYHNHNVSPVPTSKLCPVISVPSDCFNLVNGHVVRSYVLIVKVTIPKSALVKGTGVTGRTSAENGVSHDHNVRPNSKVHVSPPQVSKKTASVTVQKQNHTNSSNHNHNNGSMTFIVNPSAWTARGLGNLKPEDFNPKVIIKQEDLAQVHGLSGGPNTGDRDGEEPKPKRRRSAPARDREQFIYTSIGSHSSGGMGGTDTDEIVFMGQITIYDKQLSITLGSADYELILRQSQRRRASFSLSRLVKQEASWEILDSVQDITNTFTCRDTDLTNRIHLESNTSK